MKYKKVLEDALESGISLSFDDVTIIPNHADFNINEIDLTTLFSKNIKLKIPIVSAAMDTVTESKLAIAIAKEGGIGIIHRNMEPETQAYEVKKVKRHLNGRIENPEWVDANETLNQIIKKYQKENGIMPFHCFPVLNEESKIIGILGEDSFKFGKLDETAQETMLPVVRIEDETITINQAYDIMKAGKIRALPLKDKEGGLKGMYVFSDVKRIKEGGAEMFNTFNNQLRVGAAIGVYDDAFERLEKLYEAKVDVVVIDTAHGDSKSVLETIKQIKKSDYGVDVVAGNISRGSAVERLVKAGADGIKVGQGPGSICTTRVISGAGRAQISAIYDCAKKAEKYNIPICADGGLRYSGDIVKAIAAGAHSVMMGSMFAGTEETPGEVIFFHGRQWKLYRGMGSLGAMLQHQSSKERYNQKDAKKLVPEGVEGIEPYKGPLDKVLYQYIGGLKSGMGYAGAKTIGDLRKRGEFDRTTDSAKEESHPHNIYITKESPNYPGFQGGEYESK